MYMFSDLFTECYFYFLSFNSSYWFVFQNKIYVISYIMVNMICFCLQTNIIFLSMNHTPLKFGDYHFPDWSMALAWIIAMFPVVCIPLVATVECCLMGGWKVINILLFMLFIEEHRYIYIYHIL